MSKRGIREQGDLPVEVLRFHLLLQGANRRTQELSSAVALGEFAEAWNHACQITYDLLVAERTLWTIEPAHYERAEQRIGTIRSILVPMLTSAPLPTVEAVREVQSANWRSPRQSWRHCEAEWRAAHRVPSAQHNSSRRRSVPETIPEPFSALGALSMRAREVADTLTREQTSAPPPDVPMRRKNS